MACSGMVHGIGARKTGVLCKARIAFMDWAGWGLMTALLARIARGKR